MDAQKRKTVSTILRVLALLLLILAILSCTTTGKVKSKEGRDLKNRGPEDDDDLEYAI